MSAQNWALFFLSPNFEDMEQIDIKDISGAIQLTTLINEGCKRKFTLMKEDYIMLKFSLENPIYFKLGSYVECNFGLFEVCDLQKPAFNTNTAGYDYELQLDAYYWKWKKRITAVPSFPVPACSVRHVHVRKGLLVCIPKRFARHWKPADSISERRLPSY